MSFWALAALINSLAATGFGLFVYLNNKKNTTNISWGLFSATIAFWSYSYFLWQISNQESLALFWCRTLTIGSIFIPVTFLHFLLIWLDIYKPKKKILIFCYLISIVAFVLNFTPLIVEKVRYISFFKYWPKAGPAYFSFLIFWWWVIVYCWCLMYRAMQTSSPTKRNQIFYVFIAAVIGFSGGFTNYPLWYGIKVLPYGNILVSVYVGLMAYAIVRHRLMDIEVLVKKTLVFASLFTIVFGIFVGTALLIQQFVGVGSNFLGFAISSLIIIFTVRPLEILLVRVTDKYLFQKKYDYRHLINEFMDELKTMVLNANDIAQSTIDFLNTSIRPASAAIFMHNKFTSQYDLIASSDFKDGAFNISDGSNIIKILADTGKILNIKSDNRPGLALEKIQFAELGIEIIAPLLVHKELIGVLCLGKKKSDEDYAEDDIEALSGLSGALSISLNNAQLFDERADAEKRALVGTIATGINHEVGNPLNIITIKLDTFRILAKEGLLEKKSKEQIIEDVNEIAKICLHSAQRISEITKQVSEFAKPDKKLVLGRVNISEAIDETVTFLKHGMILDADKIEKQMRCEPVYVTADRGQLKQILFNLIKNASHAIDKEKGKIIVSVDKNGNGEVIIKIIDNGHGMPKEVMEKVFTPFFTTKEPGKGTGLGLALVKIMIDRNGGRINVESQEGKGTAFILIFKGGLL